MFAYVYVCEMCMHKHTLQIWTYTGIIYISTYLSVYLSVCPSIYRCIHIGVCGGIDSKPPISTAPSWLMVAGPSSTFPTFRVGDRLRHDPGLLQGPYEL